MPITQILLTAASATTTPTYTFTPQTVSAYEGSSFTFEISGNNIVNNTYYWTIETGSSEFATTSGSFSISDNYGVITVTPETDNTTEGAETFTVSIRSDSIDGTILATSAAVTINDNSQTPSMVFDLDTASGSISNVWADTYVNLARNATIVWDEFSSDNGGVYIFNGSSTFATVNSLLQSTYGSLTLSAWVKPTSVTNGLQTIIAKELCYKLRINGDGTVTFSTGKGSGSWEVTATVDAGVVTSGEWHHVVATSDNSYTRIYINGVKITETTGNIIGVNNAPFDIGAYSSDGNNTQADFFGGRMGEVKMWNYALSEATVITEYNTTADRYSRSLIPLSLSFLPGNTSHLIVQNTQSDWNLGTTWTIEYWSKANGVSGASPNTVMCQAVDGSIDLLYYNGNIRLNGSNLQAEPSVGGGVTGISNWANQLGGWDPGTYTNLATTGGTGTGLTVDIVGASGGYIDISAVTINNPGSGYTVGDVITISSGLDSSFTISSCSPIGVWTHVAIVSDGSDLYVYKNGIGAIMGGAINLNNSSNDLVIGKRGPENFQYFDGKLAMIRISDTAKYTANFTPTKTYGVEVGTQLMLGSAPLVDGTGDHPIDNQGAVLSTDFPTILQTFVALNYGINTGYAANQGGNQIAVLIADYPDIVNVPNGATITVSGGSTGTYTVSDASTMENGTVRLLAMGFSGNVNGSDTLTITWYI